MSLQIDDLSVSYGGVHAVRGASLACHPGEIVAVVGPNGAGKSSLLNAIVGGLRARMSGDVRLDGRSLAGFSPEQVTRGGIALVPEGRRILATLTVFENLQLAISYRADKADARADVRRLQQRFPVLARDADRSAGMLSGGEQQQLAIARALLSRPRVVLLDEPSLGLAPMVVDHVFDIVQTLRDDGTGVVLVEQNALRAIEASDRAYAMRNGQLSAHRPDDASDLVDAYFAPQRSLRP